MRLASLVTGTILTLCLGLSGAATSYTFVGGPVTPVQGKNRPYMNAVGASTGVAIGQNDTLMVARTSGDTTGGSINKWLPISASLFNANIPTNYTYASSNKDSLIVYVTAVRVDADTGDVTLILQGRYAGSTGADNAYITLASSNLPNTAALSRTRIAFPNPLGLDFRIRAVGATATDTTRIYRVEAYDK